MGGEKNLVKADFIFGIRAVIEAIHSGKEIDRVLIKKGLQGELYHELMELIHQFQIPAQMVPPEKLDRVTRKNHQGVVAFISPITYQNIEEVIPRLYEEGKVPLILLLDEITDVRNLGAIARSAEVAGVHAIVVPEKGSAQVNGDAIKTSAGALHIIPVCRTKSLSSAVRYLKNCGLKIVSATEKGEKFYYEIPMNDPLAIIMGSEDLGIESTLLKLSDEWAKIPQLGQIQSLNVSVAAGVMLFEAVRQRMQHP